MKRFKIVVSAYACRPLMGSEPGVGWNTVREISKYHDVWVLTRADNRPLIDAELTNTPVPSLKFIYCDLLGTAVWKRGLPMVHLHYYLWQIVAYQRARSLHREIRFDLAHHVTYVRHSSPSFLSLLPIPFIWGPVGGAESAPKSFWQDFSWRGKSYETLRELLRQIGEHDPFVGLTARRSVIANATTLDTAEQLKKLGAQTVRLMSQVGISEDEIAAIETVNKPETSSMEASTKATMTPIRFVSVGRLLHWKGFHLGLRAFAKASLPANAEYWIIGTGVERQRLQALSEELGIAAQVHFAGDLPRTKVLEALDNCFALVHPSLHESGGFVCLEAMAKGCPVLCLELGGPAVQVTEQTGIKVIAKTPVQVVQELANAMSRLVDDPEWTQSLCAHGPTRVRDAFSWQAKGQQLNALYQETYSLSKASSAMASS